MNRLKRGALVILLAAVVLIPGFADSLSLKTEINGVSTGISGFGFDLFPTNTTFSYFKDDIDLGEAFQHDAIFHMQMEFRLGHSSISGYDYRTGYPWWADGGAQNTIDKDYFRLYSQIDMYFEQGFGTNFVAGEGPLMYLNVRWITRFASASEPLSLSQNGPANPTFTNPPFSNDERLPAYPWLEGDRNSWNNIVSLGASWSFRRSSTRTSNYEGALLTANLEFGPSWLGNDIFPDTVTSDFIKASMSLEEYITVFVISQDNGWNWLNLVVGHSNTLGYTWGDVIPEHRLQTDRLRGYFSDSLWLRFTGPQFIATDCYPYLQLSLDNSLLFGGVQNEVSRDVHGVELRSGVSVEIHLRLFGFIHVRYRFGYDFIRGFDTVAPGWWQNGELGFYVSL